MYHLSLLLAQALVGAAGLLVAHPWIALAVGAGFAWAAREERRGSGRWRWLGVAGAGWLALGLVLLWPRSERSGADVVALAGLLALGVLSLLAILRACGFLSSSWPLGGRVGLLILFGAPLVVLACLAVALAREELFPWTDWSFPHATLHVSNESDRLVQVTWGDADDPGWVSGCRVAAQASDVAQIHMIPSRRLRQPITEDFLLPSGFSKDILLSARDGEALVGERLLRVTLDGHVLLRITSDGRALIATGDESWTGAPRFGAESEAAPP